MSSGGHPLPAYGLSPSFQRLREVSLRTDAEEVWRGTLEAFVESNGGGDLDLETLIDQLEDGGAAIGGGAAPAYVLVWITRPLASAYAGEMKEAVTAATFAAAEAVEAAGKASDVANATLAAVVRAARRAAA